MQKVLNLLLYIVSQSNFDNNIISHNLHRVSQSKNNMFRNIFDTIVDKISNLNPIRHFIKYALDKTLNQFLAKQLTLEDFKNGPLNLNNIQINCKKINEEHLVSSPYILHHGVIGFLRISLPPLSEISTKSIQITVENVQVSLKPNKNFAENFKQKMFELNQRNKFYVQQKEIEGEISENGPVDFFKQLLKNIIMNIKISVKNIVVKLYMNAPSTDKSHPQYYTMLRVPMIHLQKQQQKQVSKNQVEEIKFSILVPQISMHLLRQDNVYPDYSNVECKPGDFPFLYPTIEHPSTILLIGCQSIPQNIIQKLPQLRRTNQIKNYEFSTFSFSLSTDYTKKTKQLQLFLDIDNIQTMVNAVQLKILSRFVIQIMEFKKILKNIIEEIKLQTGESLMLNKKRSTDESNMHSDFFSSLMMSINNDIGLQGMNRSRSSGNKDLFTSIINQNKSIKADVDKFNKQCAQQFRKTMKTIPQASRGVSIEQFQAINFKNIITFSTQLSTMRIYILKYSTLSQYKRNWQTKSSKSFINQKIGSSYYQFFITKAQLQYRINQKMLDASFKNIKMYHVKIHQHYQPSSIDDYYDIKDSVDFYSMDHQVSKAKSTLEYANQFKLIDFQMGDKNHYCVQEILKINQDQDEESCQNNMVKKYSVIPKFQSHKSDAYILYKPGFSIHFDQKQNYTKINVQIITIATNFQILEDLLNIAYPIFNYRRISDMISYKRQQLNITKTHKKNLFESQYECRIDMIKSSQQQKQSNRNILVLEASQIKIGFRKGKQMQTFTNLAKRNKQKIYDEDSFNKQCFCSINQNSCMYVQLYGIQLKKKAEIKFSCKKVQVGLYDLVDSKISNLSSILLLDSLRQEDGFKFFKEELGTILLTIFVPGITLKILQKQINPIFNVIIDSFKIIEYLLAYKHYLENQMAMIQHQSSQITKKSRKTDQVDKQIRLFIDKVFIDSEIVLMKIEKIYFVKNCDGIVFKASTLVAGLKRDIRVKLCQFRNQSMLTNQYSKSSRHHDIPDSDVILQIYDSKKNSMTFKSIEKQIFFERLAKQSFSINLHLSKRETQRTGSDNYSRRQQQCKTISSQNSSTSSMTANNTFSQKFRFKQMNSTIEQQGQRFIITFQLTKNLYIYACNGLQLLKQKSRVLNLIDQIKIKKQQLQEIRSQSIILDRKHSVEIQNESIQIMIKFCQVLIDVRPDFINSGAQKIFGSTRSVLCLDIGQTTLLINKQKQLNQIYTTLNIFLYFLNSTDRQPQLSPLLLKEDPLQFNQLGYKLLLQISKLTVQLKNYKTHNILNIKIKNILAQFSLQTLSYIKLHCQHLINHHIKNQIGMSLQEIYDDDQFCNLVDEEAEKKQEDQMIVLEADQDDFFVEDLSEALEEYENKLKVKKNQERELKMRIFQSKPIPNAMITIQSFVLEKLTARISSTNDFNFISIPNMGSSLVQKRCRTQQFQQQRFLTLYLINLYLELYIDSSTNNTNNNINNNINNNNSIINQSNNNNNNNKNNNKKKLDIINSFTKLQKIKITISRQKNIGFNINTLRMIQQQIQQQMFTLCSNQNEICVIAQADPEKIVIKNYTLKMKLGATSQIVTLMKLWKNYQKEIQRSGWKKIYNNNNKKQQQKSQETNQNKKILLLIPESTLKLSLQYQNLMLILDQQKILTSQLLLNQQLCNQYALKKKIRKWVNKLIKDNLGSLISRTALNLFFKLISQIIALNVNYIGKILGFLFGSGQ